MIKKKVINGSNKIKYNVTKDNIKTDEATFKTEIINWEVNIWRVPKVNWINSCRISP